MMEMLEPVEAEGAYIGKSPEGQKYCYITI